MAEAQIDIKETDILQRSPELLALLLHDHTTGGNIFWATHDYDQLGEGYGFKDEILAERITGKQGYIIMPRVLKSRQQQAGRSKGMAEVFTPSWVVKKMVDYLDINIDTRCLELTCGEAPFLVSRYDATTGEPIALNERVGILDRKLRMVNDLKLTDEEWLEQVRQAFQTTYGYEWQGDNLLLARENLLSTFEDHYTARFGADANIELLKEFANIISWNVWQMDGLTYRTPQEKHDDTLQDQYALFDEKPAKSSPPCKIKNWLTRESFNVEQIKNKLNQDIMKFDVIIGNPPYQEETAGDNKQYTPPIYNFFIDESKKIGDIVELIHPARFLFNAGSTPKEWNKKMLNDEHFKILLFNQDSSAIFGNNIDIKGGIVVSYININKSFQPIKTFTFFPELNSILHKVIEISKNKSLSSIIYIQNRFNLDSLYIDYPTFKRNIGSDGRDSRFEKNIFAKIPIFNEERKRNDDIKVLGIFENTRTWRYISKKYVDFKHDNLKQFKVMIPVATGRGLLGETLSTPVIGKPNIAYTRSFIGIGAFKTIDEAENCLNYIKSKFCRAMLGILKITQMNNKDVWKYVPLQDFTPSSDIDWSKSIAEIDEQLFDKYGLDENERNFIRTHVKEMA